ncbi:WapI family immunity protein [Amycolatopsis sp. NPDC054798]
MHTVTFGAARGDRLVIAVRGRMHPGADDFWDGNWLISPIEIVSGGFTARLDAGLRVNELQAFREELEACDKSGGSARLTSLEDWLDLTVTVAADGRVEAEGVAIADHSSGNRLSFRIEGIEYAQLTKITAALVAVETDFPVLGLP